MSKSFDEEFVWIYHLCLQFIIGALLLIKMFVGLFDASGFEFLYNPAMICFVIAFCLNWGMNRYWENRCHMVGFGI